MFKVFLLFLAISTFVLNIQIGFTSDSKLKICLANLKSKFSNKEELHDSFVRLQNEREEVSARLIEKIRNISGYNIVGLPEEKAQMMDMVFANKLKEKIKSLNSQQLKSLEEVISRSGVTIVSKLTEGGHVAYIKNIEKMIIELNLFYVDHPASRIIMWHEFDHVIDGVKKNSFATRKLEKSAFLEQYDYIREVFKLEDLPLLKTKFPTGVPDALLNKLINANIIKLEGSKQRLVLENLMTAIQRDPTVKGEVVEYLKLNTINSFFIDFVEDALTMNKTDFLRKQLVPYRGKIAIENLIEILKYLSKGASVGAGYYLLQESDEKNK